MKSTILTILIIGLMTPIIYAQDSTTSMYLDVGAAFGNDIASYNVNITAFKKYSEKAHLGLVSGISSTNWGSEAGSAQTIDFGLGHKITLLQTQTEDQLALGLYQHLTFRLPITLTTNNDSMDISEVSTTNITAMTGNIEAGIWLASGEGLGIKVFFATQTVGGPIEINRPFWTLGFRFGFRL